MKIEIKCPKHPKYTGRRAPQGECRWCWSLWSLLSYGIMDEGPRFDVKLMEE